MKLTETQIATTTEVTVDKGHPAAMRAQFVGAPPAELDTKHPKYEPSGEMMPGEYGYARPAEDGNERGMWYFTSDRGVSMVVPPHDLRKHHSEERYNLRNFDTDMENMGIGGRPRD